MDSEAEVKTLRLQVAALEEQVSKLSADFEASKKPARKPDLTRPVPRSRPRSRTATTSMPAFVVNRSTR